jgi:hypothetical protein
MVTHNVTINVESGSYVTVGTDVILVKRPSDLAPALRQYEKPIVIESKEIELRFRRYLFLERLTKLILIGWMAHLLSGAVLKAIEKDYQVEGTIWHEWKMNKSGGTITLTPHKKIERPDDTDTKPKPL